MPQIGSDDNKNSVPLRRSIYKTSDGGKGSKPRVDIHSKQYRDNWDAIFNKGGKDANEKEDEK
jgi:hypothetical protein